jgi:transcriptional regulator with XRE-family HTH domain
MNYLNVVGPQIRRLRNQQGCSQAQLMVKIQLKGWSISRECLAKIESQIHKVTDTDLLYFADVLKVPVSALYPTVNGNGHLRESLEELLKPRKKRNPPSCSGN